MREIKFRLVRNNKIVGYEKHAYYTDSMNRGGKNKSGVYIYHSHTGHELSWKCVSMDEKNYINHDIKNQYTGFKDKNGKEIYFDSDIITDGIMVPTIVKWNDWRLLGDIHCMRDYEIIDNKYENPELLKTTPE